MTKLKIDGIVIVEGKTDTQKLKEIFEVETIETNGSACSLETIKLIKLASENNQIFLFLDPDQPGERIRKILIKHLPVSINIFIDKKDMKINSKKIGVAEANQEAIKKGFQNYLIFKQNIKTLTLNEYHNLELDSKIKRTLLAKKIGFSPCNNKQMFKRLNLLGLTFLEVKEKIKNDI